MSDILLRAVREPLDGCAPTNEFNETVYDWARSAFGVCVYNPLECSAVFVGFLSIAFWIVAQIPQVWENYRNKSASALSVGFLLFWTLGDSSNLIGCVLTNQLPTQLYTAVYFCCIDFILWSQFFYYSYMYPCGGERVDEMEPMQQQNDEAINMFMNKHKRKSRRGSYLFAVGALCLVAMGLTAASSPNTSPFNSGRLLLSDDHNNDEAKEIAGTVIAWLCAALYLSSRTPQILLNWQRESVAGLSVQLFLFAVMGNLTYVLSILLTSVERSHIMASLPYIVGSGGTLIFDFIIFVQFRVYAVTYKGYSALEEA